MEKPAIEHPFCPNCGRLLECDDTYDVEYNEEGIILYQVGHCPRCGKDYQWRHSAACVHWKNTDISEV